MNSLDIKVWAAPIVAIASICVNIYLAVLLRNKRPRVSKTEEIRTSLKEMLNKLDSRLLSEPSMQEQWDQGFLRIAEILPVCGECDRTLSSAAHGLVPNHILRAVSEIHVCMANLYHFQNSFYNFQEGRSFIPYQDLKRWDDLSHATALLHALQNANNRNTLLLHDYLRQLSK